MIFTNKYSIKFGLSGGYSIRIPYESELESPKKVIIRLYQRGGYLDTNDDNHALFINLNRVEYIDVAKEESDGSSESTL